MCGIAGLYTKSATLREQLGALLARMLEQLSDRGPDSAGVACYRDPAPEAWAKVSLHSPGSDPGWERLGISLAQGFGGASPPKIRASHAIFDLHAEAEEAERWV